MEVTTCSGPADILVHEGRVWHPEAVTARWSLGRTLHRLPRGVRSLIPPGIRESIRQRTGPFAPWELGSPVDAPAAPVGETTGPPDFVGIGVQKAGTTWWFELLVSHPAVHHWTGAHKERHFFARFATDAFGPEEIEQYHRWFPRPGGTITGEWTPDYIHQPWVAPLLRAAAPEARLLLMVRDPVERFLSGVAHAGLASGAHLGSAITEALSRGFYAASIEPWTTLFPAEQLLVLQYERCVADPTGELERTLRFLGIAEPPGTVGREPVSPTRSPKVSLAPEARARLAELFTDDVERFVTRFPEVDRALWPNFSGG